ncbi:hypothetical protein HYH03_005516 [Edaphochlamys debaryana]|uniref:non-specific serine/threonine protein kinase n=1 Tax=Edaphochlamys debaryana TaxID=47281 RepID=A0A835Y7P4_9CHLO|nr:hypothetical protein HYH03_005516 [Edaphochlamys debaryana]|eukprot:KAG2496283.1 hypothetical protein HYH03_005516 [Edaphochlamys debaryana]
MAAPVANPSARLADYDLKFVAKGSFGAVYKAVRRTDGRVFALKQVNLQAPDVKSRSVERARAIDEARMLSQLNHPHIIRHYDSFIDSEDRLNILMEFASKGSLQALIRSYRGKPMPEDAVWRVAIQALLGLNYVHAKNIIHRDIKSANLFIDANDNMKIGDFGIARVLSASSNMARTIMGTPYYLAPELCEDKPYNQKSDLWALGVVLYECMMGRYPFEVENNNEVALMRKIMKGVFKPITGPFSTALIQLATSLLTFKPEQRPDTTMLLRNSTLIAKAKALNIDLNPAPSTAIEDRPVYEHAGAAIAGPASPAPALPPGHPFASPGGGGYGSPGPQPPYPAYQQGQVPYPPVPRPGSAGGGRSPHPGQPPANHPFALAGPGGGPYGSPSPAPYGNPYASPQPQPYNPPGGGHAYGQPAAHGSPYAWQAPSPGRDPNDPWDRLAVDVNKMQLRESDVARYNAERAQQAQANIHAGRMDHAKNVIYGGPQDSGPRAPRVAPEALPAAGGRPSSAHQGAPFATHYPGGANFQMTQAQESMNEAWRANYQPPQYGRRRNPELQITGPSLRSGGATRGASARAGGYVPAADDATTYVSSTSYYTSHR